MAAQAAALNNVLKKFPNLDLFLDTDAGHHNYAKDSDYGYWTDTVVRGCGPLPFFFTMGNHEVDAFGNEWDPEWKTARMGSVGCRPYYSFDAKGIHFLVLPNLARVNYVTREGLEWAALDLDLKKDKTTIVLSHNSLKGTTEPMFDNAYRVIANSDEVYDLLNGHGRVVAWMHGHNHDYKIVPKPDRVYVSNGRLGGFPPPIEGSSVPADIATKPHIGGMYFEVRPDKYVVRAYSATEGKFFDEMPGWRSSPRAWVWEVRKNSCPKVARRRLRSRKMARRYRAISRFRLKFGTERSMPILKATTWSISGSRPPSPILGARLKSTIVR